MKRQREKEKEDKQLMAMIFNKVTKDADIQNITGIAQADDFRFYPDTKLIYWEKDDTGLINGRNRLIPLFDKLIIDRKDYNDRLYHFRDLI